MQGWFATIKEIVKDHIGLNKQLFQLAKSHLIKQYRGAAFGWAWAIIKPAVTIFVFWFAFSVGIRQGKDVNGYPFFLWLIAGFVPWFYMRDTILDGTASIRKYKYLVQRIKYPIDTVPTFVSLANLFTNLCLFLLLVVIFMIFGFKPTIYYIQIPLLYLMAFCFFTLWSLFASMLAAVSKDFLNMVKTMVTALFWLSGITYDVGRIKQDWIRDAMLYNPVTIMINGFKNALLYEKWFWTETQQMINFCIDLAIMFVLAIWAYRKLKKEIPDVL